jgi:hypothetical protein
LNRAQIHSSPQAPRCKRRTELVQPEVFRVQFRTLGNSFQAVEEAELRIGSPGGEHQVAILVRLRLPRLQTLHQLCRNRNLTRSDVNFTASTVRVSQYVHIASCSRIPVIRKNSYHSEDSANWLPFNYFLSRVCVFRKEKPWAREGHGCELVAAFEVKKEMLQQRVLFAWSLPEGK